MTPAAELLAALSRIERCVFEGLEPELAVQRIATLTGADPVRLWRMFECKQLARSAAIAAIEAEPKAKAGKQRRHHREAEPLDDAER